MTETKDASDDASSPALRAQERDEVKEVLQHRSNLPKSFQLYTRVEGKGAPCISVGVTVNSAQEAMAVAEIMTSIIAPMYAKMAELDEPRGLSAAEGASPEGVDK